MFHRDVEINVSALMSVVSNLGKNLCVNRYMEEYVINVL